MSTAPSQSDVPMERSGRANIRRSVVLFGALATVAACAARSPPQAGDVTPVFYDRRSAVHCPFEVIDTVQRTATVPRSEMTEAVEGTLIEAAAELDGDVVVLFAIGPAGRSAHERYGDGPWPFSFAAEVLRCVGHAPPIITAPEAP